MKPHFLWVQWLIAFSAQEGYRETSVCLRPLSYNDLCPVALAYNKGLYPIWGFYRGHLKGFSFPFSQLPILTRLRRSSCLQAFIILANLIKRDLQA